MSFSFGFLSLINVSMILLLHLDFTRKKYTLHSFHPHPQLSPFPEHVAVLCRRHGSGIRGSAGEVTHSRCLRHTHPVAFVGLHGHNSVVLQYMCLNMFSLKANGVFCSGVTRLRLLKGRKGWQCYGYKIMWECDLIDPVSEGLVGYLTHMVSTSAGRFLKISHFTTASPSSYWQVSNIIILVLYFLVIYFLSFCQTDEIRSPEWKIAKNNWYKIISKAFGEKK